MLDRRAASTPSTSRVDAAVGTGIGAPLVEDSGENSIIIIPRANGTATPLHIEAAATGDPRAAVLLLQLELPVPTAVVPRPAWRASRRDCRPQPGAGDPPNRPGRSLGLVDIVVPNETELALLTDDGEMARPTAAAKLSAATGARSIVVTLGEQGVYAWTPDGELAIPGHRVDAIDTVGAGDAFCGVLAARLAVGAAFDDALRYANSAGALATTRAGAEPSMPSRGEVESLLATPATTP